LTHIQAVDSIFVQRLVVQRLKVLNLFTFAEQVKHSYVSVHITNEEEMAEKTNTSWITSVLFFWVPDVFGQLIEVCES
jgi:hypothetical protein